MQPIKLELETGTAKFWMMLFIASLVVCGYFVLNQRALTNKLDNVEMMISANRESSNNIEKQYQATISTLNARLVVVEGERDACKNADVLRRGGIPIDMNTAKTCTFKGVSGTGKWYDDCNDRTIYSCHGITVDCETYKDCDCPAQDPDCNKYIC
jgi:Icc-related predicted phosphoesterase